MALYAWSDVIKYDVIIVLIMKYSLLKIIALLNIKQSQSSRLNVINLYVYENPSVTIAYYVHNKVINVQRETFRNIDIRNPVELGGHPALKVSVGGPANFKNNDSRGPPSGTKQCQV